MATPAKSSPPAKVAKVSGKRGSKPGERRGGRKKGTPNKTTSGLKEAILEAAHKAGGKGGTVGYLEILAKEHRPAFAMLLAKVLPLTVAGDANAPIFHAIEFRVVDPRS